MGKILIIKNADFSVNAIDNVEPSPTTSATLLLPASILNNLPKTSYPNLGSWISAALAKYYFAHNKKIHISYIYIRPSSTINNLNITVWNVIDEQTQLTQANNITIPVSSDLIDTSKGVNGLYKIPVDITCDGTLISIGTNNVYFDITPVSEEESPNAGYWVTNNRIAWENVLEDDKKNPIAIGYEVESI